MAEIANCQFPEDLYYHGVNNVWARDNGDGTFTVGLTDIAQSLAGSIIHCKLTKQGKEIKKNKSLATVESGKWVGPVKSPFDGLVEEINAAVEATPTLVNKSPYKQGWVVRIRPANAAADLAEMKKGPDAIPVLKAYMEEKGMKECTHCEGFEA
ncbi:MAG: glycine cleavage system protein H [Deltaproteobacteria bacterium]|nr:glycine cleavage system protein H [Deltaproteobacteria bacterium]